MGYFKEYLKILPLVPISYSAFHGISTIMLKILDFQLINLFQYSTVLIKVILCLRREKIYFFYQDTLSQEIGKVELLCLNYNSKVV